MSDQSMDRKMAAILPPRQMRSNVTWQEPLQP